MQLAPTPFSFHKEFCPETNREVKESGWKARLCELGSERRLKAAGALQFKESK